MPATRAASAHAAAEAGGARNRGLGGEAAASSCRPEAAVRCRRVGARFRGTRNGCDTQRQRRDGGDRETEGRAAAAVEAQGVRHGARPGRPGAAAAAAGCDACPDRQGQPGQILVAWQLEHVEAGVGHARGGPEAGIQGGAPGGRAGRQAAPQVFAARAVGCWGGGVCGNDERRRRRGARGPGKARGRVAMKRHERPEHQPEDGDQLQGEHPHDEDRGGDGGDEVAAPRVVEGPIKEPFRVRQRARQPQQRHAVPQTQRGGGQKAESAPRGARW